MAEEEPGELVDRQVQETLLDRAARIFLDQMQETIQERVLANRQEIQSLRKRERAVFVLSLVAAGVGIVLVIVGLVLVSIGVTTRGMISSLAGLLSGAATAPLRRLEGRIATERESVSEREAEEARIGQAIAVTAMIPDPKERSEAIAALAARLAETVGRAPRRSPSPRNPKNG